MDAISRRVLVLVAGPATCWWAVACSSSRQTSRDAPVATSSPATSAPPSSVPSAVPLAAVGDLADGPVLVSDPTSGGPAYLVRTPTGVICLSAVCTHAGCQVAWAAAQHQFRCPCHGGIYGVDGSVVNGPPPKPLPQLAVRVEDGQVFWQT